MSVHRPDTEGRAPQQDTEGGVGGWGGGGESSWSSDWSSESQGVGSSESEGVGSAMRAVNWAMAAAAQSWCVIQNYIMIYQLKIIELFINVTYKKTNGIRRGANEHVFSSTNYY